MLGLFVALFLVAFHVLHFCASLIESCIHSAAVSVATQLVSCTFHPLTSLSAALHDSLSRPFSSPLSTVSTLVSLRR